MFTALVDPFVLGVISRYDFLNFGQLSEWVENHIRCCEMTGLCIVTQNLFRELKGITWLISSFEENFLITKFTSVIRNIRSFNDYLHINIGGSWKDGAEI